MGAAKVSRFTALLTELGIDQIVAVGVDRRSSILLPHKFKRPCVTRISPCQSWPYASRLREAACDTLPLTCAPTSTRSRARSTPTASFTVPAAWEGPRVSQARPSRRSPRTDTRPPLAARNPPASRPARGSARACPRSTRPRGGRRAEAVERGPGGARVARRRVRGRCAGADRRAGVARARRVSPRRRGLELDDDPAFAPLLAWVREPASSSLTARLMVLSVSAPPHTLDPLPDGPPANSVWAVSAAVAREGAVTATLVRRHRDMYGVPDVAVDAPLVTLRTGARPAVRRASIAARGRPPGPYVLDGVTPRGCWRGRRRRRRAGRRHGARSRSRPRCPGRARTVRRPMRRSRSAHSTARRSACGCCARRT